MTSRLGILEGSAEPVGTRPPSLDHGSIAMKKNHDQENTHERMPWIGGFLPFQRLSPLPSWLEHGSIQAGAEQ